MAWKRVLKLENITFLSAIAGLAVGWLAPGLATSLGFLGDLFLVLLKMTIVPLIFVSVFLAVAKQAGRGELSNVGIKTLIYFTTTSALACLTGFVTATFLPDAATAVSTFEKFDASKLASISFEQVVLSFFTNNPFKALADGEIIQIVVFSLLMGLASSRLAAPKRSLLVDVSDAVHDLIMIVIQAILVIAPVGIFSLVAAVFAKTEMSSFAGLGRLFIAVAVAALIHSLITLPAIGFFVGRFHPYRFLLNVREALLVAFATASSSATLPVSTRVLEDNEGVDEATTGFVLPLGATLNMDGSALYQAIVVLFLGGMAGIEFTISQQFTIFAFVLLSSAGTAGIPGGGLIMMSAILQMVGIPLELIGIYLLVDRFWDPIITCVNVMGDLFGAKIIDRMAKRRLDRNHVSI